MPLFMACIGTAHRGTALTLVPVCRYSYLVAAFFGKQKKSFPQGKEQAEKQSWSHSPLWLSLMGAGMVSNSCGRGVLWDYQQPSCTAEVDTLVFLGGAEGQCPLLPFSRLWADTTGSFPLRWRFLSSVCTDRFSSAGDEEGQKRIWWLSFFRLSHQKFTWVIHVQ